MLYWGLQLLVDQRSPPVLCHIVLPNMTTVYQYHQWRQLAIWKSQNLLYSDDYREKQISLRVMVFYSLESSCSRGGDYTRLWLPEGRERQVLSQKLPTTILEKSAIPSKLEPNPTSQRSFLLHNSLSIIRSSPNCFICPSGGTWTLTHINGCLYDHYKS